MYRYDSIDQQIINERVAQYREVRGRQGAQVVRTQKASPPQAASIQAAVAAEIAKVGCTGQAQGT